MKHLFIILLFIFSSTLLCAQIENSNYLVRPLVTYGAPDFNLIHRIPSILETDDGFIYGLNTRKEMTMSHEFKEYESFVKITNQELEVIDSLAIGSLSADLKGSNIWGITQSIDSVDYIVWANKGSDTLFNFRVSEDLEVIGEVNIVEEWDKPLMYSDIAKIGVPKRNSAGNFITTLRTYESISVAGYSPEFAMYGMEISEAGEILNLKLIFPFIVESGGLVQLSDGRYYLPRNRFVQIFDENLQYDEEFEYVSIFGELSCYMNNSTVSFGDSFYFGGLCREKIFESPPVENQFNNVLRLDMVEVLFRYTGDTVQIVSSIKLFDSNSDDGADYGRVFLRFPTLDAIDTNRIYHSANYMYDNYVDTFDMPITLHAIDGNGDLAWTHIFRFGSQSELYTTHHLLALKNGGVLLVMGRLEHQTSLANYTIVDGDLFFVKLDENGESLITNTKPALPDKQVEVYPNPTSNYLHLSMDTRIGDYKVEVISIDGKMLINKSLSNAARLDVSTLANGTYIVRVITNDGAVYLNRFIKHN